jgi:DNA-binding LacI/PurR family transcriptional regulator
MTELLALPEPPDAVFCFNDMLALGAIRAAVDHGLRVPADLAVVGFDNSDHSAYSVPALTTIAPDKAALAKAAVDLVHRRASGDTDFPPQDVRIPFALEVRESSTP